jgi:hypothetical protein
MKMHILVAALLASFALAAPADAASKKKKKTAHRAPSSAVDQKSNSSYDVYVSGELVGRDPDPSIRAYMMRNPHIWDGPE